MDPWADRRASLREQIARARKYDRWMMTDVANCSAEIAKKEGLSRARVSQLLKLLKLSPVVMAQIESPEVSGPVPPEKKLRKLAGLPRTDQLLAYRELIAAERFTAPKRGRGGSSRSRVQRKGLRHQFERARGFEAILKQNPAMSLNDLARQEGLSGSRVAQLLNLLYLAPEIIAAVDVPMAKLPKGVTEVKLRGLSRLQDIDEQIWTFRRMTRAG